MSSIKILQGEPNAEERIRKILHDFPTTTGLSMQDGMLAHYLEQAKASDVNVEARLDKEPFDWRVIPKGSFAELDIYGGALPLITKCKT